MIRAQAFKLGVAAMAKLSDIPVEIRAAILSEVDTRTNVYSAARATALLGEALQEFEWKVLEAVCMREACRMVLSSMDVEKVHDVLYNFWVEAKASMKEDVQTRLYGLALWQVVARGRAATTELLQLATEASTLYATKGWKREAVIVLQQLWDSKINTSVKMGPWEAVAGGYLARAYVGVDCRKEAGLVLDECWRWRESWAGIPRTTLEVVEAFELMDRKEEAAQVLDLCDNTKVAEENLSVAIKLVQLYQDLGEEEKAQKAQGVLEDLWQKIRKKAYA